LIRFNPSCDDTARCAGQGGGMNRYVAIAIVAVVISALFWVDALFVPLVLLGPIATGVVASRRGVVREAAAAWFLAGILALVSDWAINNEDQLFHVVVAFWTAGVTVALAALARRTARA
jgi:hypothetical protein